MTADKATFYWKSTCTSCRDARAVLDERGVEAEQVNYAKRALDKEQIGAIVAAAGSVAAVLNTRHAIAKDNGWAEKPPAKEAFVKAAAAEPNLIRRPILVRGGKAILIGYDKTNRDRWRAL
jgi:arsenate reductase-like glutaredoxin family protein